MFNSLFIISHLLWVLSRSLAIHALPGPLYYYISPVCEQDGIFSSAEAAEALSFTEAALRRDNANYESILNVGGTLEHPQWARPADPNQADIFAWIYGAEINQLDQTPLVTNIEEREQVVRYKESNDRSRSTIRIECDNDHKATDPLPGRWRRVANIPGSPDQDPNRPMQNSQRNQNTFAPGTVLEYSDPLNRMRERADSNFCTRDLRQNAVLHMTAERDNQGQVEPRYVITICDSTLATPDVSRSMNNLFGSRIADTIISRSGINLFNSFRSLLFLYMLYQIPPLGKHPLVRGPDRMWVGLGDLAAIFKLGPNASRAHAGASAWYDLLAGFADRGYVFKASAVSQIEDTINIRVSTPAMFYPALTGALTYDRDYFWPPG